ncbi:17003_t:CDS:2, partial [Racocetra persica]
PIPKVLPKSRQPRPTITEVFDAYYDESAEEPLETEEKNNNLPNDRIKVARIGGAEETYPVGPYCEEVGVKKVKEKKEIEVEKEEAGVEKDEEKEVEVKREEKKETKEEKRKKYEENIFARVEKIIEDVEELTKKSKDLDYTCESWIKKVEGFRSRKRAEDGDSKEQFDPEKDLEKANEKWKKKVRVFLDEPGMIFARATSAQKKATS